MKDCIAVLIKPLLWFCCSFHKDQNSWPSHSDILLNVCFAHNVAIMWRRLKQSWRNVHWLKYSNVAFTNFRVSRTYDRSSKGSTPTNLEDFSIKNSATRDNKNSLLSLYNLFLSTNTILGLWNVFLEHQLFSLSLTFQIGDKP